MHEFDWIIFSLRTVQSSRLYHHQHLLRDCQFLVNIQWRYVQICIHLLKVETSMYLFNNYTVLSAEPGKCSKMPSVFERSRKGRLVSKLNNHGKKLGLSIFITGLKSHIWSFMFKYTPFKIN